jgi:predicted secreted protein
MGWVGTGIAYVIVWWLVFFMVLPWGVRRPDNPEQGHEAGAPEKPRLWLKVGVTSAVAAVVTAIVWLIHDAGLIDLRDPSA